MARRHFTRPPRLLDLYVRSALGVVPGASALPMVPGGHLRIPHYELMLEGCRPDLRRVARYRAVCGFDDGPWLPPTYPHVLAFPLHMRLMADGRFPFSPVGLLQVDNSITQHRPIAAGEPLSLYVRGDPLRPHRRGQTFAIRTTVHAAGQLVWEEQSTMLRRGVATAEDSDVQPELRPALTPQSRWELGGDFGRRYAAVSGDRNPIHLHAFGARAFGLRRPIAHGMWTKARCLAELQQTLPEKFTSSVRFRRPIGLPGTVEFAYSQRGHRIDFEVRGHLQGTVTG